MRTVVVVGASLAGVSAARALRSQGYRDRLVIIGDEQWRPYDRPPLSKDFLAGRITTADMSLEAADEDLRAVWLLGAAATNLDTQRREVTLDDGRSVHYDSAVIATGSRARTIPEASGLTNVHLLRTIDDARRLKEQLVPDQRLVVVGAGFVGAEVAATARTLGMDVTLIGSDSSPLSGPLGEQMGAVVGGLHESHGVRLIGGVRFASFIEEDPIANDVAACECGRGEVILRHGRRASAVRLADGTVVPADVVVLGLGGVPNIEWLEGAGLDTDGGIHCDSTGRTGADGVFAVGDCAAWFDDRFGGCHRVEHWTGAMERPARAVAALLADAAEPEEAGAAPGRPTGPGSGGLELPYFWSDQHGVRLQFVGSAHFADRVDIEAGDPADYSFLAIYYRADVPVAVLGMNQSRLFTKWRKALNTSAPATAKAQTLQAALGAG